MRPRKPRFDALKMIGFGLAISLAACSEVAQLPLAPESGASLDEVPTGLGARLAVSKSAVGEWTVQGGAYDWSLQKKVTPLLLELAPGASATLNYTLTANRTGSAPTNKFTVTGNICVRNDGPLATEGMRIVDFLEFWNADVNHPNGGDWTPLVETQVSTALNPILDAGEQQCYPYLIELNQIPDSYLGFRNRARVYIDNFAEVYDPEWAQGPAYFDFPDSPTGNLSQDATATLSDVLSCPTGMSCTPSSASWLLTGPETKTLAVVVKNVSAACGKVLPVVNTATIKETDSGVIRSHSRITSTALVFTASCRPPTQVGCAIGYWSQPANQALWKGTTPSSLVGSLFPAAAGFQSGGGSLANVTTLQALGLGGDWSKNGLAEILVRVGVMGYLNASYPGSGYPYSASRVKSDVQAALTNGSEAYMLTITVKLVGGLMYQCR